MELQCEECREVADEDAWGWRAFSCADSEDELAAAVLAFYCPVCALLEFGWPLPQRSRRGA